MYRFIEKIEKAQGKMLFPNKQQKEDILCLNQIVKKDVQVHSEIEKKYMGYWRILIILAKALFFIIVVLLVIFIGHAHVNSDGTSRYGYIGKLRDYLFFPCLILGALTLITFSFLDAQIIGGIRAKFHSFLYWYKENIKQRPEWEINKIIQEVHVPKYKTILTKIFGVWLVYVKK